MPNPKLHIMIDASRSTVPRLTGTEYYSRQLIYHLIDQSEKRSDPHEFTLCYRDDPADDLIPLSYHVDSRVMPFPRAWTHARFAAEIWRLRPDVTFVPAHTLPFVFPGNAVVTIHDLGYKHFPEAHTTIQRTYLDWTTRYSAMRATLILADSEATAEDLGRFYDVPRSKIRVVYPGVARPSDNAPPNLFDKYNIPSRYFLFIGTLQPRKNIQRIIQAFDMWQGANPNTKFGLVLAGKKGWLFDETWAQGVDNVYFTGYIDEADKGALLRQAVALVFPTLYEGFGFPVVEAMMCGTPVIASNTSSLPELVGNAGLLVNPLEAKEIAAAMDVLTQNELLRRKLRVKGLVKTKQFNWQTAAAQALAALEEAAMM